MLDYYVYISLFFVGSFVNNSHWSSDILSLRILFTKLFKVYLFYNVTKKAIKQTFI